MADDDLEVIPSVIPDCSQLPALDADSVIVETYGSVSDWEARERLGWPPDQKGGP